MKVLRRGKPHGLWHIATQASGVCNVQDQSSISQISLSNHTEYNLAFPITEYTIQQIKLAFPITH